MRVMLLEEAGQPLLQVERDLPVPGVREVLLRVRACGVCRTDLHVCDGELTEPALPLVLGHEIVGEVARVGAEVNGLAVGQRLGVPWLGSTCGVCRFCQDGAENLCAGLIGYRAYRIARDAPRLGLYGFGAAVLEMG